MVDCPVILIFQMVYMYIRYLIVENYFEVQSETMLQKKGGRTSMLLMSIYLTVNLFQWSIG